MSKPAGDWLPKKPATLVTVPDEKPEFPEIAWRGVFSDYRRIMKDTTEASDVAHFATLWAASAVALGRKVSMFSGSITYPNVYLCFYGPSGDKKTTAQRRIYSSGLLAGNTDVKFLGNAGTVEGIADELKSCPGASSLMLPEELSSIFVRDQQIGQKLMTFLTEAFDCPDVWEKHYRNNPISLEKPTPSIFGCTTPEWFWRAARPEDFAGGFGNRFLYLTGMKKPPMPDPNEPKADDLRAIKKVLEGASKLNNVRAEWSKEAAEEWKKFSVAFEGFERRGLLGEALKRCHLYVRKLAMDYAFLEGTLPVIKPDQLQAAVAVIQYAAKSAERLIDLKASSGRLLSNSELERRVIGWIGKRRDPKVRDLQQAMSDYCDAESFNRVLTSLDRSDRIEIWWDDSSVQRKRLVRLKD